MKKEGNIDYSIKLINKLEALFHESKYNFKKEIAYPIIDDLFKNHIKNKKIFKKKLKNNYEIFYNLNSRITKDFFLSKSKFPDHVTEPQTTKLLSRILKKNLDKHIILGGAFIGDMAIPLAYYLKNITSKKIHCFECDQESRKMLGINIQANKIQCIKNNYHALNNVNNNLYINTLGSSLTSLSKKKGKYNKKIKSVTIDSYCRNNNIKSVSVIHIDIEGNELNALKGAQKLISAKKSQAPDIIFEYYNYNNFAQKKLGKLSLTNSKIILYLKKYNYYCYAIRDFSSNIGKSLKNIEIIPIDKIYHKQLPYCFNIYCTKDKNNISLYKLKLCNNVNPKLLSFEDKKFHWPIHK